MTKHQTICGAFCSLVICGLIFGFGLAYLIEAVPLMNDPAYLWYWSVITVALTLFSLINAIITLYRAETVTITEKISKHKHVIILQLIKDSSKMSKILAIASYAMFIWGCVIYNKLQDYQPYPEHLFTWFKIIFIFNTIIYSCIGCLICCGICGLATGTAKLSLDDDSDDESISEVLKIQDLLNKMMKKEQTVTPIPPIAPFTPSAPSIVTPYTMEFGNNPSPYPPPYPSETIKSYITMDRNNPPPYPSETIKSYITMDGNDPKIIYRNY
jgi:hypothetical protein